MNARRHPARSCRGYSIIELLVAAALTAILLGGVITIFMSWRSSSRIADQLSHQLESGRRGIELMAEAIRAAGYPGCTTSPLYATSSVPESAEPVISALRSGIRAYGPADPHRQLVAQWAERAAEDAEILLVRGIQKGNERMRLMRAMETPEDPLVVSDDDNAQLRVGDIAMIYSCTARAYFVVSEITGNLVSHTEPMNATNSLDYAFGVGAEILPLTTTLFYVGSSSGNTRTRSLWQRTGTAAAVEVVRNVDGLVLLYGSDVDEDGVVDNYETVEQVDDWGSVRSVAAELRLAAPAGTENRIRSSSPDTFKTVIALRNRPH